jgi:hypothetical protein
MRSLNLSRFSPIILFGSPSNNLRTFTGYNKSLTTNTKTDLVGAVNELGDISLLQTDAQSSAVGAINELKGRLDESLILEDSLEGSGKRSDDKLGIKAGGVTTAKLADEAVTTGKLADEAVTTGKLADEAVITAKLADEAVITAKLADEAVTEGKIADGAVTTDKIEDEAVTTVKIADEAVTEAKLDSALLGKINGKLDSASVESGGILTGDGTAASPLAVDAAVATFLDILKVENPSVAGDYKIHVDSAGVVSLEALV